MEGGFKIGDARAALGCDHLQGRSFDLGYGRNDSPQGNAVLFHHENRLRLWILWKSLDSQPPAYLPTAGQRRKIACRCETRRSRRSPIKRVLVTSQCRSCTCCAFVRHYGMALLQPQATLELLSNPSSFHLQLANLHPRQPIFHPWQDLPWASAGKYVTAAEERSPLLSWLLGPPSRPGATGRPYRSHGQASHH